ncbi:nucleotidyltransferase family protein [Herbaspirillum sp. RV1423]|uniref:nucleotidyltransferase family protein n=1 Tax=Herbaspirillum sp. RV1423 TaxID=1443993 RepID=UPI001E2BD3AB|nr:nucleotidyltransferase family protein [Herbaspirillum sp. RV1423]
MIGGFGAEADVRNRRGCVKRKSAKKSWAGRSFSISKKLNSDRFERSIFQPVKNSNVFTQSRPGAVIYDMKYQRELQNLILNDAIRLRLLRLVAVLDLPDCWVGAGFIRNAVWDSIHGRSSRMHHGDIDVIWFDPLRIDKAIDHELESLLSKADDSVQWSVKNQGRMHIGNDDAPYSSATDAMRFWPETATAVGIRVVDGHIIEIAAPYGLDDLYQAIIRPTARFLIDKKIIFEDRIRSKRWIEEWPHLQIHL